MRQQLQLITSWLLALFLIVAFSECKENDEPAVSLIVSMLWLSLLKKSAEYITLTSRCLTLVPSVMPVRTGLRSLSISMK